MASSGDEEIMDAAPDIEEEDDDLFGGDDEDIPAVAKTRELSDQELDSGDDEDRNDREPEREEVVEQSQRAARIADIQLYRHMVPNPVDGEINTLRMPQFLGIDPYAYAPETFKIPEADHHSTTKSANFSAHDVSASTIRFRNGHRNNLESNTNIYKWSDGSTTISIGDQHYEFQSKPLAPAPDSKIYSEQSDSHWYIGTPEMDSQTLLLVGHIINEHSVIPNDVVGDDAVERLTSRLAAAKRGNQNAKGPEMINSTQDPELEKRRAELAEKERMKAQRRRENAAEKASQAHRPSGGRSGGLNLDDLEGRSSRRAATSGRKVAKPKRNRHDYDSDDEPSKGRNAREESYDMDDGFLVGSDDEEEAEQDDDEEEEEEEESDRERHPKKKQKTTSSRHEEVSDADADAEADLDDEDVPAPQAAETAGRGRKGRHIIEDDDDE